MRRKLADEAELYKHLAKNPLDLPERAALEGDMIMLLAHLSTHSQVLHKSVDKALEAERLAGA